MNETQVLYWIVGGLGASVSGLIVYIFTSSRKQQDHNFKVTMALSGDVSRTEMETAKNTVEINQIKKHGESIDNKLDKIENKVDDLRDRIK